MLCVSAIENSASCRRSCSVWPVIMHRTSSTPLRRKAIAGDGFLNRRQIEEFETGKAARQRGRTQEEETKRAKAVQRRQVCPA